jgi:peptidoglycan/LPS O-acetylase OafA/YrhL
MPIITLVNQLNVSVEFKLLLSLALTISIAYTSFKYFEKPVARLIRRAAPKKSNKSIRRDCEIAP